MEALAQLNPPPLSLSLSCPTIQQWWYGADDDDMNWLYNKLQLNLSFMKDSQAFFILPVITTTHIDSKNDLKMVWRTKWIDCIVRGVELLIGL